MPGSTGHDGNEPHQPNAPTSRPWPKTAKAPANPARSPPDSKRPPPASDQSETASSRKASSTPPNTDKSPTPSQEWPTSSPDNPSRNNTTGPGCSECSMMRGKAADAFGPTPAPPGQYEEGQATICSNPNCSRSTSRDQSLVLLPVRLCTVPPAQGSALGHGVLGTGHLPGHHAGRQKAVHLDDLDRSGE